MQDAFYAFHRFYAIVESENCGGTDAAQVQVPSPALPSFRSAAKTQRLLQLK